MAVAMTRAAEWRSRSMSVICALLVGYAVAFGIQSVRCLGCARMAEGSGVLGSSDMVFEVLRLRSPSEGLTGACGWHGRGSGVWASNMSAAAPKSIHLNARELALHAALPV